MPHWPAHSVITWVILLRTPECLCRIQEQLPNDFKMLCLSPTDDDFAYLAKPNLPGMVGKTCSVPLDCMATWTMPDAVSCSPLPLFHSSHARCTLSIWFLVLLCLKSSLTVPQFSSCRASTQLLPCPILPSPCKVLGAPVFTTII